MTVGVPAYSPIVLVFTFPGDNSGRDSCQWLFELSTGTPDFNASVYSAV